jgi:hypothetical protein
MGYDTITDAMQAEDASAQLEREAREQKEQQKALIDRWIEKLTFARKHDSYARKRWADDRRVARGESEWLVDANLIGAMLEVLGAFIYARNPDISIKPSPSANRALLKEYRSVAETLEIMVSRMLRDAGLKRVGKRWVRGSMTVGTSWIKCAMQTRTERDPLMEKQINDLQDNLKRIDSLQQRAAEGDESDPDATKAEIQSQIVALQGQVERQIAEGLVLDLMAPEDVIVAPECGEVENYLNAPWLAFDMYKDLDETLAITGWKKADLDEANRYMQRPRKGEEDHEGGDGHQANQWVTMAEDGAEGNESADGFYRWTEIWSLRDGVVYTSIDGIHEKWAREPYAPRTGVRFYPNFLLSGHAIDGERWPQSDVYQLKKLQDEYANVRSNFAKHRERAVPSIIFDETSIEAESVAKLRDSQVQEYVGVKPLRATQDMRMLFAPKVYNPVDMNLYNTQPIVVEMEKISGVQDALQGGIMVEKTATEAQIQESGRSARTGARLDNLEDALSELAEYAMQLILLSCDQADAIRYAGPEAVWIDMTTEEALTMFSLEIKAGSTGKPKANSDRETWATLMPLLEGLIDRIGQARMQGQEWAAAPWIAMLKETSQRLDDFADIEKFLPVPPPELVQSMAQGQKPSEKELAETRNEDADTLKKLADAVTTFPAMTIPARPIVQEMVGQGTPQMPPPAPEMVPAAPSPLPTEIN